MWASKTPQLRLAFKGGLLFLFFFAYAVLGGGVFFGTLAALGAFALYLTPLFRARAIAGTFVVFVSLALFLLGGVRGLAPGALGALLAAGVGVLIFGIKDLVLVRRELIHRAIVFFLYATLGALALVEPGSSASFAPALFFFLGAALLFKELLLLRRTLALAAGLLFLEILIGISALGLSAVLATAALLLASYAVFLLLERGRNLTRRFVLTAATTSIIVLAGIFSIGLY